jgi:hypothetical protein
MKIRPMAEPTSLYSNACFVDFEKNTTCIDNKAQFVQELHELLAFAVAK